MKTSRDGSCIPSCTRVRVVFSPHTLALREKVQQELRMLEQVPGAVPQVNIGGFPPRTFVTDKV